jgi:hypothetical protein
MEFQAIAAWRDPAMGTAIRQNGGFPLPVMAPTADPA